MDFKHEDADKLKGKLQKIIYHVNIIHKKAKVATLISDKVDFKTGVLLKLKRDAS